MKCPKCGAEYACIKVIDSRETPPDNNIRRRRECMKCGNRFTTYEITSVEKAIYERAERERNAVLSGLTRLCEKYT